MTALTHLLAVPGIVAWATDPDPTPTDDAVKAGWVAFTIFLLLIAAVALLCWSFTKQLRKVNEAKAAGVYGDDDSGDSGESGEVEGSAPSARR